MQSIVRWLNAEDHPCNLDELLDGERSGSRLQEELMKASLNVVDLQLESSPIEIHPEKSRLETHSNCLRLPENFGVKTKMVKAMID